jgi:hypothetical protein
MRPSAAAVQLGPLYAAVVIVFGGVLLGIALGVRALNRRVARLDAEARAAALQVDPHGAPYRMHGGMRPAPPSGVEHAALYYLVSVFCWPAAFAVGAHLLREARTARVGRACMMIGMGIIGATTALTCAAVIAGALSFSAASARAPAVDLGPRDDMAYLDDGELADLDDLIDDDDDPPSEGEVVRGAVGEELPLGDLFVRVNEVDITSSSGARKRTVAVDVSFRNAGPRAEMIGMHLVTVFDAEGFVAERSRRVGRSPGLTFARVTPGNVARGWVTVELEEGATVDRVQIHSGTGLEIAEVAVGRGALNRTGSAAPR